MKFLSLIMWVGQFGFSVIFPTLVFFMLGNWLQGKFGLGLWVVLVCGLLGILTSIRTARSFLHTMKKTADASGENQSPPISFNDHI